MPNDMKDGEREVSGLPMSVESSTVALLNKSEIDQQIATAHKFPRSIATFLKNAKAMVTLNEQIARECVYALPRDGKMIEGASARFAEIVASAYQNLRIGARVVNDQGDFITAQGVAHDLENNVAITFEVQRRIVDRRGNRYSPDMVGVTGNAASSIALRNAILKVVPKAFWAGLYDAARHVIAGDVTTLASKRTNALKECSLFASEAQVLKVLGRAGVQDITIDDLVTLAGLLTAIKEKDISPEEAFADPAEASGAATTKATQSTKQVDAAKEALKNRKADKAKPAEGQEVADAGAGKDKKEKVVEGVVVMAFADVEKKLRAAKDVDALGDAASLISAVESGTDRQKLVAIYTELKNDLTKE